MYKVAVAIPRSFFTVTDICDGIAQGHDEMNYFLASREFICAMIEIHAKATPFDGLVPISSRDKVIPAHLMVAARLGLPAVHVLGGTMPAVAAGFIFSATALYGCISPALPLG